MNKELAIAIKAAQEAGALLKKTFKQKGNTVSYKTNNEPVSLVDYACNDIVLRHINRAFPKYAILSEESHGALQAEISNEPTWIIDPLDGTSNFIAGIPLFAVAIALVKKQKPVVGVIYDPIHDELFSAQLGMGTKMNNKKIAVSNRDITKGAMLFAGRGYKNRDKVRHGKIIYALEKQTTYFRRLGSAAIMLSSVAAGRADSVILTGNKPWDTVGGALLIKEAGGKVTDYCGKKWNLKSPDLVATNGHIHTQLTSITKPKC